MQTPTDIIGSISQLTAMFGVLSVSVERALAIIMPLIKLDDLITNNELNVAIKQTLSAGVGAGIYLVSPDLHIGLIDQYFSGLIGPIIVGAVVSGGAGFWHDILSLVSTKTKVLKAEVK